MRNKFDIRTVLAVIAAILLTGCFKDVSYNTTYVLKPLVQRVSGDVIEALPETKAYAFDADTSMWTVASYEDALNGILSSHRVPVQTKSDPVAVATPFEGLEGRLQMPLTRESQMILVVDTRNKIYAYTQQLTGENLPYTYVTLVVRLWKRGKMYVDGNWQLYNEFYVAPPEIECTVEPKVQLEQNGAETVPSSVKVYAFDADTTLWYIASYKNAAAGVITSKKDTLVVRDTPEYAYKKGNSYIQKVSYTPMMLVIVDQTNGLYAYTKQEVDLEGGPLTLPFVFRKWKNTYLYVDEGWRVVNDALKPAKPKPDPDDPLNPANKKSSR